MIQHLANWMSISWTVKIVWSSRFLHSRPSIVANGVTIYGASSCPKGMPFWGLQFMVVLGTPKTFLSHIKPSLLRFIIIIAWVRKRLHPKQMVYRPLVCFKKPKEKRRKKTVGREKWEMESGKGTLTPIWWPSSRAEFFLQFILWLEGSFPDLCPSKKRMLFDNASA